MPRRVERWVYNRRGHVGSEYSLVNSVAEEQYACKIKGTHMKSIYIYIYRPVIRLVCVL